MADLPKVLEWLSENLAPKFPSEKWGHVPHSTNPPPPRWKSHLWRIFFALPAINAELKGGEPWSIRNFCGQQFCVFALLQNIF